MPRTPFEDRQRSNSRASSKRNPAKKSFRKRPQDAPTWDEIPCDRVHLIVCLCSTHGASPTFSYTRDGSSLVLAVYSDSQRYVDYLASVAEVDEYITWLAEELLELTDTELSEYAFFATERPQEPREPLTLVEHTGPALAAVPAPPQNGRGRTK